MTEQKTKRRGWVKNAIIIFLAVMLVLVFFSNTIMNRSLPEVATQYTSSGQINALIRGSGTAVANETFEVKIDQTRTVLSTHVRVGDEVQSGQLLFRLQDSESDELGALREELDNKEYNYRMAMLDASLNDGTQLSKDIQRAQEDLREAQEAFNQMELIPEADITELKAKIDQLKEQVTIFQAIYDADVKALEELPTESEVNAAREKWIAAQEEYNRAENKVNSLSLRYKTEYLAFKAIAWGLKNLPGSPNYSEDVYREALAADFGKEATAGTYEAPSPSPSPEASPEASSSPSPSPSPSPSSSPSPSPSSLPSLAWISGSQNVFRVLPDGESICFAPGFEKPQTEEYKDLDVTATYNRSDLAVAYTLMRDAEDERNEKAIERDNAETAYNTLVGTNNVILNNQKTQVAEALNQVKTELEYQQQILEKYEKTNSDYADAKQNLRTLGDSLDNLLLQQRQQGISQTKTAMELERQRTEIEELKTKIAAMETGGEQTEVLAAVSGIVRSLNVSSGNKAQADSVLATIEVPDRGYTLNMSVTNEQASKVVVGDMAEVTSYYWGSSVQAQLVSIRNDPERRGEGKLLLFNLTGNVESGSQYNLAIGERSQYYDIIVPNSAIHEDTNGTYVYVVEAKNSPLGNRFFVTRVGVTVLAKDDNNSAVSGSLSGWNSSVVTASPPLTNGMQVRLAENP